MSKSSQHNSTFRSIMLRIAHRSKLHSCLGLILIPTTATLGILALVSVFFASADSASNTYAANLSNQITTEVDGQYYVTLTAPDVTFSVSPSNNQNAAKQRVDVGVETNVAGGAKLYLSMAGTSNSLHLNGDTSQTTNVIAATAGANGLDGFADNTWGYSTDDQTYSAVPTTASDPALLATIDGETTGTTSGSVISASIPVYYAAKVDTSIQPGSYSNRVTYSAVTDGGIVTGAALTKIVSGGIEVDALQPDVTNTLYISTNLMTNTYGVPRVYYQTTDPAGYQECMNVLTSHDESGILTLTCDVVPTNNEEGITIHLVPKGSSDDFFCSDGTYPANTSDCDAGTWQWGNIVIDVPEDMWPKAPILYTLTYMQDMTPEICEFAPEGDTAQLIDKRDNKTYWVAKLADGNCWMTQNLDLDLSGRTLTPSDSDVSSNWRYSGSWYTSVQNLSTSTNAVQGWDLGEYVWTTPGSADGCWPSTNLSDPDCAPYWQSTAGMTPMTTIRDDGIIVEGSTYDAHYLAGNYYSWTAATAGTGSSATSYSDVAEGSICPAGWRLPSMETGYGGSFKGLISAYNIGNNAAGGLAMSSVPLYFVKAGDIGQNSNLGNRLFYAGEQGAYWSNQLTDWSTLVSILSFGGSSVSTSTGSARWGGDTIRCVAKGQWD